MNIPRMALGTVQSDADVTGVLWGLLAVLEQHDYQVQAFRYQANFCPCDGIRAITGQGQRHLDSWLMPRELCTALFEFGTQGSDMAVVEGRFDVARPQDRPQGGSLDTLCEWLDLPRIAVVDATRLAPCKPLPVPGSLDAILLDGVEGPAQAAVLATELELRWRAPVLGYMPNVPELRKQLGRMPRGASPRPELCRSLGQELYRHLCWPKLLKLASRNTGAGPLAHPDLASSASGERLRIAIAFDEAFQCYFPDTLDVLEACGAQLRAFSPLRSPELPPDTDVVYLGCGRIDRYAEELSANLCLRQSIQSFAAAGGRIYAEGGGLAYLCRQIVRKDGTRLPMVNALPAIAARNPHPDPPEPAVVRLRRGTWLGEAFQELRGYLNTAWTITPWGALTNLALEPERQGDLFGQRNVVGSRLHFNFAAQPQFLRAFFCPCAASYVPV